jgi:hypothetical protein
MSLYDLLAGGAALFCGYRWFCAAMHADDANYALRWERRHSAYLERRLGHTPYAPRIHGRRPTIQRDRTPIPTAFLRALDD